MVVTCRAYLFSERCTILDALQLKIIGLPTPRKMHVSSPLGCPKVTLIVQDLLPYLECRNGYAIRNVSISCHEYSMMIGSGGTLPQRIVPSSVAICRLHRCCLWFQLLFLPDNACCTMYDQAANGTTDFCQIHHVEQREEARFRASFAAPQHSRPRHLKADENLPTPLA